MPVPSIAETDIVTVPFIVEPLSGDVIETAGGVVSAVLLTFIAICVLAMFADVSLATAVRIYSLLANVIVFSEAEYGVVVSSTVTFVPFIVNCTPAMPVLSDANAETTTVPFTV